jgi:hypothetical protein
MPNLFEIRLVLRYLQVFFEILLLEQTLVMNLRWSSMSCDLRRHSTPWREFNEIRIILLDLMMTYESSRPWL